MKRMPVKSSNIASIGWEAGPPPWVGTMEVEFHRTGGEAAVYEYSGVSAETTLRVLRGELQGSVGHTFHFLVRRQDYQYRRVSE